jgi:hypothetical protein
MVAIELRIAATDAENPVPGFTVCLRALRARRDESFPLVGRPVVSRLDRAGKKLQNSARLIRRQYRGH